MNYYRVGLDTDKASAPSQSNAPGIASILAVLLGGFGIVKLGKWFGANKT